MIVRAMGGFKIKLESGKLLPKVYPTRTAAQKRIAQLKHFSRNNKRKKK